MCMSMIGLWNMFCRKYNLVQVREERGGEGGNGKKEMAKSKERELVCRGKWFVQRLKVQ